MLRGDYNVLLATVRCTCSCALCLFSFYLRSCRTQLGLDKTTQCGDVTHFARTTHCCLRSNRRSNDFHSFSALSPRSNLSAVCFDRINSAAFVMRYFLVSLPYVARAKRTCLQHRLDRACQFLPIFALLRVDFLKFNRQFGRDARTFVVICQRIFHFSEIEEKTVPRQ